MPKFENQGFSSKKRIDNERRDRSVPENENYYDFTPVDLNFNNRENDADDDYQQVFDYQVDINDYTSNHQLSNSHSSIPTVFEDFDSGASIFQRESDNQIVNNTANKKSAEKVKTNKRRKRNKSKAVVAIVAILLAICILPAMLVNSVMGKINYTDAKSNITSDVYATGDVKNILLLGVDARQGQDGEASRADTMMLITLDSNNKCIKMTSFLRDTWVYIPAKDGKQRLNAACSYGGYQGVVDTIEYNFGVDIDGYVVADFEMFKVLVDSIGGVEVEVSEKEANEVTNHPKRYGNVVLEAGTHNLTGEQALAYCRIRKIDTDFVRTQRQRTVITAILNKVKSTNPITLYNMVEKAAPYIETSLTKSQIYAIALSSISCLSGDMMQEKVPFEGTWNYKTINGASVISIDVDENKQMLIDYLYNKATANE